MHIFRATLFISLISLFVSTAGCTAIPATAQAKKADYGTPVSRSDLENKVRREYGFFDPYSAVIRCAEPRKAWADFMYEPKYGYLAQCNLNGKNRLGAYVGEQTTVFIVSGRGLFEIRPGDWKFLDDFFE